MQSLLILFTLFITPPITLYDFDTSSKLTDWRVVNDVVMGGRSTAAFSLTKEGHGLFKGEVSLENNGGFSSLRCSMQPVKTENSKKVVLRIKGDGKRYQFRLKSNSNDYYSYIQNFETNGKWQTLELDLNNFYPSFRGRKLDMPNFSGEQIEEATFLIANKKAQAFQLIIDFVGLK